MSTDPIQRASQYRLAGHHREAAALCQQRLQQSPDSAPAWHLLGLIHCDMGKYFEATQVLEKAIALDATQAPYFKALADTRSAMGDTDRAILAYRQALSLQNDYFEVHSNLGGLLLDTGHWEEAIDHYRQAVQLRPDIAELHDNLGNALRIGGYCESAISCHEQALRLKPALATAQTNIGSALVKLGRQSEAVRALESALELAPEMPETHFNLAVILSSQGRLDQALTHYRAAGRLRPDYLEAVAAEASLLAELGETDSARKRLEPYADRRTRNSSIALAFSTLAKDADQQHQSIDDLEHLFEHGLSNVEDLRRVHFRLADLYDQTHHYAQAFIHYRQGNELKPRHFDREDYGRYIDMIISTFSRQGLARLPRASNDSQLPVFIVGMPRSGKSLIEQILASHPQVTGAGELGDIREMPRRLEIDTGQPFPAYLGEFGVDQLDELASAYLSRRQAEALPGTRRVTDTMPFNIEQLGFIAMLFPHAHIGHCCRDPRDMLLECYFKDFGGGHTYANDLADLGYRYRQYHRLRGHWKDTLALPQLEIQYEDLVRDPATVSRQLVEYLGLEWQARCLKFYESFNTRLTGKASFKEPINQRSVGRWKNYQRQLTPLIEALQQ